MRFKTILLTGALVLMLAGVIAATTGAGWWKRSVVQAAHGNDDLPGARAEYGRLMKQFRVRDSAMDIWGMIRIYDEEKGGELREARPFRYYRSGFQYYSELSYLQTYCDGKMVLEVDTLHRRMRVSKFNGHDLKGPFFGMLSAEQLFSDTGRLTLNGTLEQRQAERVLTLHSDNGPEIRACRVYYDTISYRLHRTEIEWWKDMSGLDTASNRVWLAKLEYNYRERGDPDIGKEMRTYIVTGPGGIKSTGRYANFKVVVNF